MNPNDAGANGQGLSRRNALKIMIGGAGILLIGPEAGAATAAPASGWSVLRGQLDGTLVTRRDSIYEGVRREMLWNALKTSRKPDAIVRAANDEDVRDAVRYARANGLKVAVRGGGHNMGGAALRDGGLLIDLGQLNALEIDVENRTASAQPAARNAEIVASLSPLGLAFPVGHCPSVALSGYLLNGGIGWNSNVWGPACMSVRGIELVTAEGELIHADEKENADYFWAARGAGPGFFGVVTRYHLQLHSLPKAIRESTYIYALKDLDPIAAWLPELAASLRREVEMTCLLFTPPPAPGQANAPAERVFLITAAAFADTADDARAWLAPLEGAPVEPIHKDVCVEATLESMSVEMEAAFPQGMRMASDSFMSNAAPGGVLAAARESALAAPSPQSFFMFAMLPAPPADAPPPPDMAFSIGARCFLGAYSIWESAENDGINTAWLRQASGKLSPGAVGHYIGEADLAYSPDRPGKCFSPAAWERLQALKKQLDPDDVFYWYPTV